MDEEVVKQGGECRGGPRGERGVNCGLLIFLKIASGKHLQHQPIRKVQLFSGNSCRPTIHQRKLTWFLFINFYSHFCFIN